MIEKTSTIILFGKRLDQRGSRAVALALVARMPARPSTTGIACRPANRIPWLPPRGRRRT